MQCHKIASIDTENRVITVKRPYHYYGYRDGQWFLGFNLLCELDMPGEWYNRTAPRKSSTSGRRGRWKTPGVEVSMCNGMLS